MKKHLIAAVAALAIVAPLAASADTLGASAGAGVSVAGISVRAEAKASASAGAGANAKARADQEIARRTASLGELSTRVSAMTHVSADFKASLAASIQSQISSLATLKATVDADAASSLKADVQSITKSYRIYMLVIPQARIAAAADRVGTIVGMMDTLGTKLNARIATEQGQGTDVSAWTSSMADFSAKVADAQAQANAAASATASLRPDNGDATVAASNDAALKAARADIKSAQTDLKAARQDAATVMKGLKVSATASTAVSQ